MRSVIVICNSRVTLLVSSAQMTRVIISCYCSMKMFFDFACRRSIRANGWLKGRYQDEQVVMQLVGCMVTKTL